MTAFIQTFTILISSSWTTAKIVGDELALDVPSSRFVQTPMNGTKCHQQAVVPLKGSMHRRVISIRGDGNCLFRSIAYCVFGTQERHREVRVMVINRVVQHWNRYKDFIIGDSSYYGVKTACEYKNLMLKDGEYAGHVELHSASEVFTNYTFKVHIHGGEKTVNYGYGSCVKHLLFSGYLDAGHYSVLDY